VVVPSRCTDRLETSKTNNTEIRLSVAAQSTGKKSQATSSTPARAGTAARSCRCLGSVLEVSATAAGRGGSLTLPRGDRV
jgi:hypothetical protein